jgi:hypothetical protein
VHLGDRRLRSWLACLVLTAVAIGCGDSEVTRTSGTATSGEVPEASPSVDEFIQEAVNSIPPDQKAALGGDESVVCLYTAYVDAIGYEQLLSAGVDASEYGLDPMASSYDLPVDDDAARSLRAEVLRCMPDPVEMFIDSVMSSPDAIAPGYEDSFADCYRASVTIGQAADDIVADFVESHADDLPTDLAYFKCAGTVDT